LLARAIALLLSAFAYATPFRFSVTPDSSILPPHCVYFAIFAAQSSFRRPLVFRCRTPPPFAFSRHASSRHYRFPLRFTGRDTSTPGVSSSRHCPLLREMPVAREVEMLFSARLIFYCYIRRHEFIFAALLMPDTCLPSSQR